MHELFVYIPTSPLEEVHLKNLHFRNFPDIIEKNGKQTQNNNLSFDHMPVFVFNPMDLLKMAFLNHPVEAYV